MEIESWKIWTLIGGIPAIISAVIGGIWLLTSKRVILKWTSRENLKLEEIKGEIAKNNIVIRELINTQSNAYLIAHDKRLNAIEQYWNTYLKIKKAFPSSIYLMYTILTKEEIENILHDFEPTRIIPTMIRAVNAENYTKKLMEETEELDYQRIYIEPNMWAYFFIYRAFCARLVNWIDKGQKQGKIELWTREKQMKDLLKVIFSEDEIMKAYGKDINSLQYVFDLIEIKILNEITELTTGAKQSKMYFEQIRDFNQLLAGGKK